MSIETELQQALDTIDSMEQHTAAAYAALQRNGATLPEKCNLENLAETVEGAGNPFPAVKDYGRLIVKTFYNSDTPVMGIQWGSMGDVNAFAQSDRNNRTGLRVAYAVPTSSSSSGLSVIRSMLVSIRIGDVCKQTPDNFLADWSGGDSTDTPYLNPTTIDMNQVEKIGSGFLQHALRFNGELLIPKVRSVGGDFMRQAQTFSRELRIPASLQEYPALRHFMHNCYNLSALYIEEGAKPPDGHQDYNNLDNDTADCPAYQNGVVLRGPGAKAWKRALANLNGNGGAYRNLVVDPGWA